MTTTTMTPPTLERYLSEAVHRRTNDSQQDDIADIVRVIAQASKLIGHKVAVSSIEQSHVGQGSNESGDDQKALDVISNDYMIEALQSCGKVSLMVSEEDKHATVTPKEYLHDGQHYACVFDPLDGSSNIECSVSVGTIFGIYPCDKHEDKGHLDNVMRPGRDMIAAGYILYSTATILVLSVGHQHGVRAFTNDPSIGEFVEYPQSPLKIPAKPKRIVSGNTGNAAVWNLPTSEFLRWTRRQKERYSMRYIGSMVADVHRTLLYGGIFMYPADYVNRNGKLRTLYECFPMAFLAEAGGGVATTGTHRILDITPSSIHQRMPIYLGCKRDVNMLTHLFERIPHLFSIHCAPDAIAVKTSSSIQREEPKDPSTPNTKSPASASNSPVNKKQRKSTLGDKAFWEVEMGKYMLTEQVVGDEDCFELSANKGALFQELVCMNDAAWTLATCCVTGQRGLLPTQLLVASSAEIDHLVAVDKCDGDDEMIDFRVGDAALKVRYMNDRRWCHAVNARTGQSGIVPAAIFVQGH
eukprot:m.327610 g.327610  ORF g.327610 m.327610 type:complete len:525 (+) comp20417_c0_seq1:73-1647(+)